MALLGIRHGVRSRFKLPSRNEGATRTLQARVRAHSGTGQASIRRRPVIRSPSTRLRRLVWTGGGRGVKEWRRLGRCAVSFSFFLILYLPGFFFFSCCLSLFFRRRSCLSRHSQRGGWDGRRFHKPRLQPASLRISGHHPLSVTSCATAWMQPDEVPPSSMQHHTHTHTHTYSQQSRLSRATHKPRSPHVIAASSACRLPLYNETLTILGIQLPSNPPAGTLGVWRLSV